MHFKKIDSTEFLLLLPTKKKKQKLSRIVQLRSLRKKRMWRVKYFYVDLWVENTNPQHLHTLSAISKLNFSEKIFIRQKILHKSFETYGQDRFWLFSVCCFKSYSGVLAFGIFTAISTTPKINVNAARLIYIRTGGKIGMLSENKLS